MKPIPLQAKLKETSRIKSLGDKKHMTNLLDVMVTTLRCLHTVENNV